MLKKMLFAALALGFSLAAGAQEPAGKVKVGDKLYDVELHDTEGNYSYLADYAGQDGKYLLVLFWTSNCPRCHASFPEVAKYAKKYADKLSVVCVMLSDNHEPEEGKIVRMWSGFKLDRFQTEMQPYFAPVE